MRGFLFLTGTDTAVGKTYIGCRLARSWRKKGAAFAVRKPAESGCPVRGGRLLPQDASLLKEASGSPEPLEKICPYPFRAPLAPPQAARLEGRRLTLDLLIGACLAEAPLTLIEGAGGFLSPIAEDGLNADLALALKAKVLLVAEDRLGAIHQVLATLEAIERRGLEVVAVVLNRIRPQDVHLENGKELRRWTSVPLLPSEGIETFLTEVGQLGGTF